MKCPACGAEAPSGARFCASCGQELLLRGDERRIATVVFGDLVGFTGLSETRDPEQVKKLVDECFEQLVAVIESFGGRVDKIVGDAIVALFGAPVAHEDDAERAVRAALRMQQTLRDPSAMLGDQIEMRIGVNTGEVLVGALRAGGDYTAMGDVVNTASRLQTSAAPGQVLVGPETHRATRDVVTYESCDPIEVKGKVDPVPCWIALGAEAPPGHRPNRPRVSLVGREHETTLLQGAIATAIDHQRASMLLVNGEAGVGKSRLANEVATWAADECDALVLEGRCVPYGEANVWWPVAEALRQSCGIDPSDDVETARLATESSVRAALGGDVADIEVSRVVAGLMHLMGHEGALGGIDAARDRDEAISAVVTFADGYSRTRPVMVVLSDLHWADDQVLELLDTMLERLSHRPYTVLATARNDLTERWDPPAGHHSLVVLHLDPLSDVAARRLIAELGGGRIDDDLTGLLLERAGGNPFFLEELISLLDQVGPTTDELPSSLRALVAARLDALDARERAILDDAAVLGRTGPVSALEVMSEVQRGDGEIRADIDRLVAKELLAVDDDHWEFRSDLVREVAYSTLTRADRAKTHAGIAAWCVEHENVALDSVVERIAHHYRQAAHLARDLGAIRGVPTDVEERARLWLVKAARRAAANDLGVATARLYEEALELADAASDEDRRDLELGRAKGLLGHSDVGEAVAIVERVRARAEADGDDRQLVEVRLLLGQCELRAGRIEGAIEHLEAALALATARGDRAKRAEAIRQMGMVHLLGDDHEAADRHLGEALGLYEQLDDAKGAAWALQNLAWSSFIAGRPAEAEPRLRQAIETFSDLGDAGGLGWAMGLLAWVRFHLGSPSEAEELAERVLDAGLERGDRWGAGMMQVLLTNIRMFTGRTTQAIEAGESALAIFEQIGDTYGHLQALAALGRAQAMAGRLDSARATFDLLARESAGNREGFSWSVPELLTAVSVGDLAWAERIEAGLPGDPIDTAQIGGVDHIVARALLDLQRRDAAAARAWLELVDEGSVNGFVLAGQTLLAAADGAAVTARDLLSRVQTEPASTYLDRIYGALGAGLAEGGSSGRAVLRGAVDEAERTDDRVTQLVARLADAIAASIAGDADADAVSLDVEHRMAVLDVDARGWRRLFESILSTAGEAVS